MFLFSKARVFWLNRLAYNRVTYWAQVSLWALLGHTAQANESQLWQDFKAAKAMGTEPAIPDFSYAGYDYSQSPLPNTQNWPVFFVTDYGAKPNDEAYDDAGIQAAIDAAEANGKGVVAFPKGVFKVSPNEALSGQITVQGSNIVLKGSGASAEGTVIFMDKKKVHAKYHIIHIAPKHYTQQFTKKSAKITAKNNATPLTHITQNARRETFNITVADASQLRVGQRIMLRTESPEFAQQYYAPLPLRPEWTRLFKTGFKLQETHAIAAINGNIVRLREPLHISLNVKAATIAVYEHATLHNVGVEDILFKGNWNNYPEAFVHHKDKIHDYGWNALRIESVENGWVQRCEFKDWNQNIFIASSAALTLTELLFSGKKGHMAIHSRSSYGVLIKDSQDIAGHHHGPGVGYWGAGTVYLRYKMAPEQSIDSHSGSPYATLFDNVRNGHLSNNGGPLASYPHHGRGLVIWNFLLQGGPNHYDFWPKPQKRRMRHVFAMPFIAGLHGKKVSLQKGTFAANESQGKPVQPSSLFEAQLALRLAKPDKSEPSKPD